MKILIGAVILVIFICVHLIKMMRLYLIVMDQKVSFDRFVPAYLRTTLVNLLIPYKLGEIYRIIAFSRISRGFKTGFFSVLIDRFFDTLALCLILLPYQILYTGSVAVPTILLVAFVAVIVITYMVFPASYTFLNRYIITSRDSKRSMMALSALEHVNGWYTYVRDLVAGRYGILFLFSLAAWILEMTVLAGFTKICDGTFAVADFGAYIESIVSGKNYDIKMWYTNTSAAVIAVLTVIFTVRFIVIAYKTKHLKDYIKW
ncbi:MAG: flippase-like domain-containing protein [Lachnospiraceae bacterium]|nr:flippase-like domain-containing protein [Lachnospiraceae bacterium]